VKLPTKVKIGIGVFKIKETDNLSDLGNTDSASMTIDINKKQNDQQKVITTLHEVIHGIFCMYNISRVLKMTAEQEETLVCLLEPALCSLIKDNPELIKLIATKIGR